MTRRTGMSQEELRRSNCSALLTYVHHRGPTTRARLTTDLGLNRSTIGDLTGQLAEWSLVEESAPGVRAAGRSSGRPSLLVTARRQICVLAVTLDVDRIEVALVGLGGVLLERQVRVHQPGGHDVTEVVETVALLCEEILGTLSDGHCLGVGVSVPGSVRARDGMVRFAPNLGWVDAPFTELMQARLNMPVHTGNDANLGVYAEHLRGVAVGSNDVAYVAGSVGIGGGFLVQGRMLGGDLGYAGEVGHLLVDSGGEACRCGSLGCWETKIGSNQVLVSAGRLPGGGMVALDEVIAAADAGEERAARAIDEAAHWTGYGLRSVVRLFNPHMVVLGGVLGRLYASRASQVEQALHQDSSVDLADSIELRVAALGQDAPLLGAAELAFEALLRDPSAIGSVGEVLVGSARR